jgi:hypothetical protein
VEAARTGKQRYTHLEPDFTLGTTSSAYGTSYSSAQDLPVRAQLAGAPTTAAITVIPDYLDAPGTKVAAGNFTKVTHLRAAIAAAQQGGTALVLLELPARDPKYLGRDGKPMRLVSLATNVTFPTDADVIITVDNDEIDPKKDILLQSTRPTVMVRKGSAVVAIGVLDAGGLDCRVRDGSIVETGKAEIHLKPLAEATASHGRVARLAIYHDQSLPADTNPLSACFARAAFLFVGAHCEGSACARAGRAAMQAVQSADVSWNLTSGEWDVRARVGGGPELHVRRKVGENSQTLLREVDGHPLDFGPLVIQGDPVRLGP